MYPFGFGLSYTTFALENVTIDHDRVTDAGIEVQAKIRNTGGMAGGEVLQVYVKAEREGAPNPQLKAFRKDSFAAAGGADRHVASAARSVRLV